jgi:hypothetical protein
MRLAAWALKKGDSYLFMMIKNISKQNKMGLCMGKLPFNFSN